MNSVLNTQLMSQIFLDTLNLLAPSLAICVALLLISVHFYSSLSDSNPLPVSISTLLCPVYLSVSIAVHPAPLSVSVFLSDTLRPSRLTLGFPQLLHQTLSLLLNPFLHAPLSHPKVPHGGQRESPKGLPAFPVGKGHT